MNEVPLPGPMSHPETDAVHAGNRRDPTHGALAEPIVLSSTFDYPELADGSAAPYIYSRYDNPTIRAVEQRVAALETSEDAVLFASGMAAISGALLSVLRHGEHLVTSGELYGGTRLLFDHGLARFGIPTRTLQRADLADPERLLARFTPQEKVLYLESPTNPMLRLLDIPALTQAAQDTGRLVVLDNTFAGPLLARPTTWGIDLVCESATKSMGGHSDLIAGVVAGSAAQLGPVRETRKMWGLNLDPSAAYRLHRGLMTLPVRIRQTGKNALALAERLAASDWVTAVHQPHLDTHPDHDLAQRTLDGPLPLVTVVAKGGEQAARHIRRSVRLIRPAASLGGSETLLSLPSETSHAHLDERQRAADGIPPGAIRIAVGLEHPDDLFEDLQQAAETT